MQQLLLSMTEYHGLPLDMGRGGGVARAYMLCGSCSPALEAEFILCRAL